LTGFLYIVLLKMAYKNARILVSRTRKINMMDVFTEKIWT